MCATPGLKGVACRQEHGQEEMELSQHGGTVGEAEGDVDLNQRIGKGLGISQALVGTNQHHEIDRLCLLVLHDVLEPGAKLKWTQSFEGVHGHLIRAPSGRIEKDIRHGEGDGCGGMYVICIGSHGDGHMYCIMVAFGFTFGQLMVYVRERVVFNGAIWLRGDVKQSSERSNCISPYFLEIVF